MPRFGLRKKRRLSPRHHLPPRKQRGCEVEDDQCRDEARGSNPHAAVAVEKLRQEPKDYDA
ncbi:MAG: hypothetical protein LBF22_03005, partial [Deltaproteobacteria bacterium]|nr:hypothetical protein [Deltaproteobacteria bacterium]